MDSLTSPIKSCYHSAAATLFLQLAQESLQKNHLRSEFVLHGDGSFRMKSQLEQW